MMDSWLKNQTFPAIGKTKVESNPENLFLSMLSIAPYNSVMVTICIFMGFLGSISAHTYWTYVLNPPLWQPVTWADPPFPVSHSITQW
jgi:hypothetical protein